MVTKEKILEFERILNNEMKDLIGTRNWNVLKKDIEPEMYNVICTALYKYGESKWKKAQRDAAAFGRRKHKVSFPVFYTPFKP